MYPWTPRAFDWRERDRSRTRRERVFLSTAISVPSHVRGLASGRAFSVIFEYLCVRGSRIPASWRLAGSRFPFRSRIKASNGFQADLLAAPFGLLYNPR